MKFPKKIILTSAVICLFWIGESCVKNTSTATEHSQKETEIAQEMEKDAYDPELAKKFGADAVLDAKEDVPARVLEENDERGADLVITATGAKPALKQALDSVGRGGTILWFAPSDPDYELPIPFTRLWKDEVSTVTSYAGCPEDIRAVIELLEGKRLMVEEMITHRLPLEETSRGFRLVAEASTAPLTV